MHISVCLGGQGCGQQLELSVLITGHLMSEHPSSPLLLFIGHCAVGHLKETTIGLGQQRGSGRGQDMPQTGGGGQQGLCGQRGWQGLTMTQQGGNGLQQGIGHCWALGILGGGGQQLFRIGRTKL